MKTLIPLQEQQINQQSVQTVNARELHAFLEVKTKFAIWITNRIKEYGFVENVDFITFSKNLEKGGEGMDITAFTENSVKVGRPATEYHLTLDMGKELAMVERNEKGRQARHYFIECEKRLHQSNGGHIDLMQLTEASRQALQLARVWELQGSQQRQAAACLVE